MCRPPQSRRCQCGWQTGPPANRENCGIWRNLPHGKPVEYVGSVPVPVRGQNGHNAAPIGSDRHRKTIGVFQGVQGDFPSVLQGTKRSDINAHGTTSFHKKGGKKHSPFPLLCRLFFIRPAVRRHNPGVVTKFGAADFRLQFRVMAYCSLSMYARTGASSVSRSLLIPPPMHRMSGWKV